MKLVSIYSILIKNEIKINSDILIKGWLRNKRSSNLGISFLDIYDGSCINTLQIIANNYLPNYNTEIIKLTSGCSISVRGILVNSKGVKQVLELIAHKIIVIGLVKKPETYPISPKKHSNVVLREVAHLRMRTMLFRTIFQIRHYLFYYIHHFFYKQHFFNITTPIITSLNTEGAGNLFQLINNNNHTSKNLYLTVSGQLHLEAFACALGKVYTFGPVFRAENSNTTRHLAEFWMLEAELAFTTLSNLINFCEKFLKYLINKMLNNCINELIYLDSLVSINLIKLLNLIINQKFIEITYTEVINILQKHTSKFSEPVYWGMDLHNEHEKYLTNEYFNNIVIIKHYPKQIKPFYMKINQDNKTVAAIDILCPYIGELIGGSQREDNVEKLITQIDNFKLKSKIYEWYLDLRKYGSVPHSGFGIGFDRLLCFITGQKNIKDVVPFPRTISTINF